MALTPKFVAHMFSDYSFSSEAGRLIEELTQEGYNIHEVRKHEHRLIEVILGQEDGHELVLVRGWPIGNWERLQFNGVVWSVHSHGNSWRR